jgi:hypothetical protein
VPLQPLEKDVSKNFRSLFSAVFIATLSIGGFALSPAPASAQKAVQQTAMKTDIAPKWLLGHWSAARADITTLNGSVTQTTISTEYWLDLDISRNADGALEALVTARQMGHDNEYVTWKADVTIESDVVAISPREIVGKKEWWLFDPVAFQMKRRDDKLVGRTFNKWWKFEFDSALVTLER